VKTAALWICAIIVVGCAGEGNRQVIDQTRKAGQMIEADENLPPPVRQAGWDIDQNMAQLQKEFGTPTDLEMVAAPYSPDHSKIARELSEKDRTQPPPWLVGGFTLLDKFFPGALAVLGSGWGILAQLRKGKVSALLAGTVKRLTSVYDGVQAIKTDIGAKIGAISSLEDAKAFAVGFKDTVNDTMREVAGLHNTYNDIKAELAALKAAGTVKEA
jgi:hypothetical protein